MRVVLQVAPSAATDDYEEGGHSNAKTKAEESEHAYVEGQASEFASGAPEILSVCSVEWKWLSALADSNSGGR